MDYRAPAGSPVVAVADGTVVSAGVSGASGRMVHLRHANGYESEYLHLSTIAVRAGSHVRQGELIGRVGATGLATAPQQFSRSNQPEESSVSVFRTSLSEHTLLAMLAVMRIYELIELQPKRLITVLCLQPRTLHKL